MKVYELRLNIPTLSINSIYNCGNPRLGKTKEAQEWTTSVFKALHEYHAELQELEQSFDIKTLAYKVEIHAHIPKDQYFTKKGLISNRTHDLSNFEKPLIDLIFLSKHYENAYPYGCKNLNIDDKHIISLTSSRNPSNEEKPYIIVKLSHIPLPTI